METQFKSRNGQYAWQESLNGGVFLEAKDILFLPSYEHLIRNELQEFSTHLILYFNVFVR